MAQRRYILIFDQTNITKYAFVQTITVRAEYLYYMIIKYKITQVFHLPVK